MTCRLGIPSPYHLSPSCNCTRCGHFQCVWKETLGGLVGRRLHEQWAWQTLVFDRDLDGWAMKDLISYRGISKKTRIAGFGQNKTIAHADQRLRLPTFAMDYQSPFEITFGSWKTWSSNSFGWSKSVEKLREDETGMTPAVSGTWPWRCLLPGKLLEEVTRWLQPIDWIT